MLRSYLLLLITGLLLTAARPVHAGIATSGSDSALYAVQLRASEDRALITGLRDSLARRGLPVYMTRATAEGRAYYRLRLGPFRSRGDARRLADFLGFSDYWLTDVAGEHDAFTQVVTQVVTDAVRLEPMPPYVFIGERHPIVVVRRPTSTSALAPPSALVYAPKRDRPMRIDHMTGFEMASTALLFGQAERVFVNPRGKPVSAFEDAVVAFSRAAGLSRHVVRDGLTFYNDSVAVRFTMLRAYDIARDTLIAYPQPGFDYVTAGGERERFTGRVTRRRLLWQGNARAWRLMPRGAGNLVTDRTALYVRPTARGDVMELGIAFFTGRKGQG